MSQTINGSIYRYTHDPTIRYYIGQFTTSEKVTRDRHERTSNGSHINNAIQQHGIEEFTFCILHEGITDWAELNRLEIAEIEKHDSFHNGFNEHPGGQKEFLRHEAWDSAEEIGIMYAVRKMSAQEIAERFGASAAVIYDILDSLDIQRRENGWQLVGVPSPKRHKAWDSAEEIAGMYTVQKMSAYEIGNHFGATPSVIYHILDSLNIPRRTNGWWLKDKASYNRSEAWEHTEEIGGMYIIQKMSARQIAKHLKTNSSTIYGILDSLDIPRRENGWWTKGVPSPKRSKTWNHAEEIADMYTVRKMTAYEIADHFGVSVSVIYNILDAQDIPRRTHQREEVWAQAEEVVRMYDKVEMTLTAVALSFDTSITTIRNILQSRGIRLRGNRKVEVWDHAEEIADMYEVEYMSTAEIADYFGVVRTTINTILRSLGITLRTGRKSQLLRLERERCKSQLTFEFA